MGAKGIDFVALALISFQLNAILRLAFAGSRTPFSGVQIPTSTQKKDYFAGVFLIGGRWGIRTPDPLGVNEML